MYRHTVLANSPIPEGSLGHDFIRQSRSYAGFTCRYLFYSVILRSRADSLSSHVILRKSLAFYGGGGGAVTEIRVNAES